MSVCLQVMSYVLECRPGPRRAQGDASPCCFALFTLALMLDVEVAQATGMAFMSEEGSLALPWTDTCSAGFAWSLSFFSYPLSFSPSIFRSFSLPDLHPLQENTLGFLGFAFPASIFGKSFMDPPGTLPMIVFWGRGSL